MKPGFKKRLYSDWQVMDYHALGEKWNRPDSSETTVGSDIVTPT